MYTRYRRILLSLSGSGILLLALFPGFSQESSPQGAKLGIWSPEIESKWWQENTEPDQWIELVDRMSITLREAHRRHGLEKMIANPHWRGWMLHTRWLSLFPRDWQKNQTFSDPEGQRIFRQVGGSHELRNRFFAALSPDDDQKKAAEILCRIAAAHPDHFRDYINLAIAYTIVFDQDLPKSWPHPYVEQSKLPVGNPDPADRFSFYVQCDLADKLTLDIKEISVQNLKFLVDSPLEFKELGYAQQMRISTPGRLADLYQAIPYNSARIENKEYLWSLPQYRLIDIGNQGGICMDLAFFVSHSGKALGIPTILFIGQGLSGEHAWVGFMNKNGSWKLDAARYRSEEYPIGQAYDPQTWERITESEIVALERGGRLSRGQLTKSQSLLQWASLNREDELYAEILRRSRLASAKDPRPWQLEADWREENETDPEELLRFWSDWVRHFGDNKDLEVQGQMRLVALAEESGRESDAERLRQKIMSQNRSKRFDLGIAIAAEPVFRKLRKRQFPEAKQAFDAAMRRYQSQAGGFLFYNLIEPYVRTCIQEGQYDLAREVPRILEKEFQASPGSILDRDLKEMIERVETLR